MAIVISGPPVAPGPTIADRFEGITVQWIGWDGSVWDLGSGAEGVVLQGFGTEGLHDPVVDVETDDSPAFHGSRTTGWLAQPRDVWWPLKVYADDSATWADTYARFFDSIDPLKPGRWIVSFRGVKRELKLVGAYDRSHAFGVHPTVLGWGSIGVRLRADQPFWEGDLVTRGPWSAATPELFFSESGDAMFNLNRRSSIGSAKIDNPGRVEAYPVWTVDGSLSAIELGVGTLLITPPNVASGKRLLIDTDPRNVTALLGDIPAEGEPFIGTDYTETLGFQEFAPVPSGTNVPIHVQATGVGSVSCSLLPLHFRAM